MASFSPQGTQYAPQGTRYVPQGIRYSPHGVRLPAGPLWTPALMSKGFTVSGPNAWLKSNDVSTITKDGSNRVSAMAHHNAVFPDPVVQATSTQQPLYIANFAGPGLDGITFDGAATTGDILKCLTGPFSVADWIFTVWTRANAAQNGNATSNTRTLVQMANASGGTGKIYGIQAYRTTVDAAQNIVGIKTQGNAAGVNSTNLAFAENVRSLMYGGFLGGAQGIGVNGDLPLNSAVSSGASVYDGFAIGGNGNNIADYFAGTHHETVGYPIASLPGGGLDYERLYNEGYMAWAWNLQGVLRSDHPFKNFPPYASQWTGNVRRYYNLGNSVMNYFAIGNGGTGLTNTQSPVIIVNNQGISGDYLNNIYLRGIGQAANSITGYITQPVDYRSIMLIGEAIINGESGPLPPGWNGNLAHDWKLYVQGMVALAQSSHYLIFKPWYTLADSYALGGSLRNMIDNDMWPWAQANYPAANLFDPNAVGFALTAPGQLYDDPFYYARGQSAAALFQLDHTHPEQNNIDLVDGNVLPPIPVPNASINIVAQQNGWLNVGIY